MSSQQQYTVSADTEVELSEGSVTDQEMRWLRSAGILGNTTYDKDGHVNKAQIDFESLAKLAFEYDLLQSVASRVEIDILEYFRRSSENTHTTSEIAEATGRPKSSISRALSNLVEKDKLTKVQSGVYRHSS